MNRRRMMMLQSMGEEIPRERLVFSKADDVIAEGVTKKADGEVICGFAIISQNYYNYLNDPFYKPYWIYLILMTKSGRNDNAIIANKWATNNWRQFTGSDGLVHYISSTGWDCNLFNSVDEGIAYINTINTNNLPILNEISGKIYEGGTPPAGGKFHSIEAARDLLDYYYGKI